MERRKVITPELVKGVNKLLFNVFLPATAFSQVINLDFDKDIDILTLGYTYLCLVVITLLAIFLAPMFEKDRPKAATSAQALFRGNTILFGLAISESIYGQRALPLSTLLVSLVGPFMNIMGVVCFSIHCNQKADPKKILLDILKTPSIVACFLGIVFAALRLRPPEPVMDIIGDIGAATTPVAIITLGATISVRKFREYRSHIFWVTLLRQFVIPITVIGVAALLGMRNEPLVAIAALYAAPVATSAFPVAAAMGGDADLAAQLQVSTSTTCIVSVFLIVFVMRSLALI